ncbi:MAG: hypothetical protein AAF661_10120 [Pseudomonadota bacterium]
MIRSRLLATTAMPLLVLAPLSGALADGHEGLPAVSTVNGKLAAGGGAISGDTSGFVEGSLSIPVGHSYGVQIDGLGGVSDDDGFFGAGAHVFWRDPDTGLIGLFGSVTNADFGEDYTHFVGAVEGEYYAGRVSVEGFAGFEGGDDVESGFIGIGDLAYYPEDDLRLSIGARYIQEDFMGAAGAEYQINEIAPGVSLFAEGRAGDDDNWQAVGGIRIHLGADDKTLIRRHREDDPKNRQREFLLEVDSTDKRSASPSEESGNESDETGNESDENGYESDENGYEYFRS